MKNKQDDKKRLFLSPFIYSGLKQMRDFLGLVTGLALASAEYYLQQRGFKNYTQLNKIVFFSGLLPPFALVVGSSSFFDTFRFCSVVSFEKERKGRESFLIVQNRQSSVFLVRLVGWSVRELVVKDCVAFFGKKTKKAFFCHHLFIC